MVEIAVRTRRHFWTFYLLKIPRAFNNVTLHENTFPRPLKELCHEIQPNEEITLN